MKGKKLDFQRISISPTDLLSGVQTLTTTSSLHYCPDLDRHWEIKSERYIEWAARGFNEGNDYGYSVAMGYSKLATCRLIDSLLWSNHLRQFLRDTYPKKIELLRSLNIDMPDVVHELIIDPRNALEHAYKIPNKQQSKHALEIAQLAIKGIKDERGSVLALNWRSLQGFMEPKFKTIGEDTFLFIDVFDGHFNAQLVDPKRMEVRVSDLSQFSHSEITDFAKLLRETHMSKSRRYYRRSGYTFDVWEKLKGQAGL